MRDEKKCPVDCLEDAVCDFPCVLGLFQFWGWLTSLFVKDEDDPPSPTAK